MFEFGVWNCVLFLVVAVVVALGVAFAVALCMVDCCGIGIGIGRGIGCGIGWVSVCGSLCVRVQSGGGIVCCVSMSKSLDGPYNIHFFFISKAGQYRNHNQ